MPIRHAQGHNQQASASALPYEPHVVAPVQYDVEHNSDGLGYAVGGGTAELVYDYLELDELQALLEAVGISEETPTARATLFIPDALYQIPTPFNCMISLPTLRRNPRTGFYENVRFEVHGAIRIS